MKSPNSNSIALAIGKPSEEEPTKIFGFGVSAMVEQFTSPVPLVDLMTACTGNGSRFNVSSGDHTDVWIVGRAAF